MTESYYRIAYISEVKLVQAVNFGREGINDFLGRNGDLILARWSKKSKQKREALLKTTELFQGTHLPYPEIDPSTVQRFTPRRFPSLL